MGFTKVKAVVSNAAKANGSADVELLVDTGATFTTIPRAILDNLGVVSVVAREFIVADGRKIQRDMGAVLLEVDALKAVVPVLFAEDSDVAVLGVTAMESLGLEVDPTTRTVKHVPLIQA